MSQDWNEPNPYRDSDPRFEDAPPEKAGMSTGMKVLLILLAVGAVCMLLCCGVFIYFGRQIGQSVSKDPAVVRTRTKAMADIEIPMGFEPAGSMEMKIPFLPEMRMVGYALSGGEGGLFLMQIDMPIDQTQLNEQQIDDMMRQQEGQGRQARDLEITEQETRTFTVDGQEVDFTFAKGTDQAGKEFRQVMGAFPGKTGTVILVLQVEEAKWDEEAVVQMLESLE